MQYRLVHMTLFILLTSQIHKSYYSELNRIWTGLDSYVAHKAKHLGLLLDFFI